MSDISAEDSLSTFQAGQRGRIVSFDLPPDQRQRLLEMGMTVGSTFEVIRFAPLGDPIDLRVRGYHLSIRRHEAAGIRAARL